MYDKDNDEELFIEILSFAKKFYLEEGKFRKEFLKYDQNHNGKIELNEFKKIRLELFEKEMPNTQIQKTKDIFNQRLIKERTKNKSLYKKKLREAKEEAEKIFKKYDINGDGTLSLDELMFFWKDEEKTKILKKEASDGDSTRLVEYFYNITKNFFKINPDDLATKCNDFIFKVDSDEELEMMLNENKDKNDKILFDFYFLLNVYFFLTHKTEETENEFNKVKSSPLPLIKLKLSTDISFKNNMINKKYKKSSILRRNSSSGSPSPRMRFKKENTSGHMTEKGISSEPKGGNSGGHLNKKEVSLNQRRGSLFGCPNTVKDISFIMEFKFSKNNFTTIRPILEKTSTFCKKEFGKKGCLCC